MPPLYTLARTSHAAYESMGGQPNCVWVGIAYIVLQLPSLYCATVALVSMYWTANSWFALPMRRAPSPWALQIDDNTPEGPTAYTLDM